MNEKYFIGLWNKTSKKQTPYCDGKVKLNGITYKVLLFKNSNKKTPKHPDYTIMLSKV